MSSLRAEKPKNENSQKKSIPEKPKVPEKGTKVVRRKCETVLDSRKSESLMESYLDTKVKRKA